MTRYDYKFIDRESLDIVSATLYTGPAPAIKHLYDIYLERGRYQSYDSIPDMSENGVYGLECIDGGWAAGTMSIYSPSACKNARKLVDRWRSLDEHTVSEVLKCIRF